MPTKAKKHATKPAVDCDMNNEKTPVTVSGNNITNMNSIVVNWDQSALKTIDKVAEGLLNLSQLFISQKVQVDSTALKISNVNSAAITENRFTGADTVFDLGTMPKS